MNATIVLRHRP